MQAIDAVAAAEAAATGGSLGFYLRLEAPGRATCLDLVHKTLDEAVFAACG